MMARLDEIGNFQLNGRIAIIIRHGERYAIPPDSYGAEVLLTPLGILQSLEFGRKLACQQVVHVYASPIERCVQTAQYIVQGGFFDVNISIEDDLGNPGLHISDADLAGEHFLRYGAIGVFEKFVAGEKLPGIADASFLRGPAVRWIERQCDLNGISVFVTHDALIAHLAYANSICRYTHDSWVGYTDGIVLRFPEIKK